MIFYDADIVYFEEQAFQLQRGSFALFSTDGNALHCNVLYLSLVLHLKYVYHYFVYIEAYYSQFSLLHQIIDKELKQNIIWSKFMHIAAYFGQLW